MTGHFLPHSQRVWQADSHASFPIFQLFLAVDLFHLKSRLEHSRKNMVQRTGVFLPIVGMTFLNKGDINFYRFLGGWTGFNRILQVLENNSMKKAIGVSKT
jgi:hypothetical protein